MIRTEISKLYNCYLEEIADIRAKRYSLKSERLRGLIHGLGVALDYDYETVELDIAHAIAGEYEQVRFAI